MTRRCVLTLLLVLLLTGTVGGQPAFVTIQDAQTTGNGTAVDRRADDRFVFYVEWSSGTSAGVITIEEASDATYSDTWSTLTTVTWAAASTAEAVHLGAGAYGALRARISTTVVGGTVTVKARGMRGTP